MLLYVQPRNHLSSYYTERKARHRETRGPHCWVSGDRRREGVVKGEGRGEMANSEGGAHAPDTPNPSHPEALTHTVPPARNTLPAPAHPLPRERLLSQMAASLTPEPRCSKRTGFQALPGLLSPHPSTSRVHPDNIVPTSHRLAPSRVVCEVLNFSRDLWP